MTIIRRFISDLMPHTSIEHDKFFYYVANVYSKELESNILPPSCKEFFDVWNSFPEVFSFLCIGDSLEECKRNLEGNSFPRTSSSDFKAIVWNRMILAFNMYAAIRKEFCWFPYNKVDLIGSSEDENVWKPYFNDRCVLFISDDNLYNLLSMVCDNENAEFWRTIFNIYDSQRFNIKFFNPEHIKDPESTSRCLSNISYKKISDEIIRLENIPVNVRKYIYETCIAYYISHPI